MKFLVDTQPPRLLAERLSALGHESMHVSELTNGNRSTDAEIAELADAHEQVVLSKDRDFRDSHLLRGSPARLLAIVTGNCSNAELLELVLGSLEAIVAGFDETSFVELTRSTLVLHGGPQ